MNSLEITERENERLKKDNFRKEIENMKLRERIRELEATNRNHNNHKRRFRRYG